LVGDGSQAGHWSEWNAPKEIVLKKNRCSQKMANEGKGIGSISFALHFSIFVFSYLLGSEAFNQ